MSDYASDFEGKSPAELREYARKCRIRAIESWERSDTDGFLSQAASTVTAEIYETQAAIVDTGGRRPFPALFDLEGNQVPAVRFEGQYGMAWKLLDPHAPDSRRVLGYFNESKARKPGVARMNDAKKGYYVGRAMAPAVADCAGNRSSFWAIVRPVDPEAYVPGEIVDNGIGATNLGDHYKIMEM
jgi:hypothetical protein